MKPKPVKQVMWALYDHATGDMAYDVVGRFMFFHSRQDARLEKMHDQRAVKVEVHIKPVEGK